MTDDELREIEARAAAATKGPWFYNSYNQVQSSPFCQAYNEFEEKVVAERGEDHLDDKDLEKDWPVPRVCSVPPVSGDTAIGRHAADAEFIAHARTDAPALIAEVRMLRALLTDTVEYLHRVGGVASAQGAMAPWLDDAPKLAQRLREARIIE